MKKIIFLLLSLLVGSLFSSCNTTKRAEKRIYNIVENHQELLEQDTVKVDTTLTVVPAEDSVVFSPDSISEDPEIVRTEHGRFVITRLPSKKIQINYLPDSVDIHFRTEKIYDKIVIEQPKEKWRDVLFAIIVAFVGLLFLKMFFERLMK